MPQARDVSQSYDPAQLQRELDKAQRRVDEQCARLQHMTVCGFPTQAADDLLCKLSASLRELQDASASARGLDAPPPGTG